MRKCRLSYAHAVDYPRRALIVSENTTAERFSIGPAMHTRHVPIVVNVPVAKSSGLYSKIGQYAARCLVFIFLWVMLRCNYTKRSNFRRSASEAPPNL